MPDLPAEVYVPVITALISAIVYLFKSNSYLQKEKLQMVLNEAKESMNMAKAVMREEDLRGQLLEKLARIEQLLIEVTKTK